MPRSIANSAGALRLPDARLDACRFGIALYGLSPFGTDPADEGLVPVLRWTSHLAQVKLIEAGESTGYGRRFVAERADLDRARSGRLRGRVPARVDGDGGRRRRRAAPVVGTVSMDCFAVALDRALPVGTPVTIVGDGVRVEEHARGRGRSPTRSRPASRSHPAAAVAPGRIVGADAQRGRDGCDRNYNGWMIDPRTTVGAVELGVSDLARTVDFYRRSIGLSVLAEGEGAAELGVDGSTLVRLVEQRGARRAPGATGLFHLALLVPDRPALARWLAHAARERIPLQGMSDHFVSEAIYLGDPDGHGIEVYRDRDRSDWEGKVDRMTTMPLDVTDLLGELEDPATSRSIACPRAR